MAAPSADWAKLWTDFVSFQSELTKSSAVNVNAVHLRDHARELVQHYFRRVRPELDSLRIDCTILDAQMQRLLQLANGRNAKSSYQSVLRALAKRRADLDAEREQRVGAVEYGSSATLTSGVEQAIAETLERLVPSAALSYRQAISDLSDATRLSYRGPAADLRECLRETLDTLAPDKDVTNAPGFKPEKDAKGPTMKQKVRFILKSRGQGETARSTPEASATRIEESAGVLARSLYSRGAVSTHIASSREEVRQLKLYLDGVLAELLQIHRGS